MPELSGSASERPEPPIPKEAEENDLKYNLIKIIETLKEKMKSSLKDTEEKTIKKLEKNQ